MFTIFTKICLPGFGATFYTWVEDVAEYRGGWGRVCWGVDAPAVVLGDLTERSRQEAVLSDDVTHGVLHGQ